MYHQSMGEIISSEMQGVNHSSSKVNNLQESPSEKSINNSSRQEKSLLIQTPIVEKLPLTTETKTVNTYDKVKISLADIPADKHNVSYIMDTYLVSRATAYRLLSGKVTDITTNYLTRTINMSEESKLAITPEITEKVCRSTRIQLCQRLSSELANQLKEDVAQEVFMTLYQNSLTWYLMPPKQKNKYIETTIQHKISEQVKKINNAKHFAPVSLDAPSGIINNNQSSESNITIGDSITNSTNFEDDSVEKITFNSKLQKLEPEGQQIARLLSQGYTQKEVIKLLDISLDKFKSFLFEIRKIFS